MSAAIRAEAEHLTALADFLERLTTATIETGCQMAMNIRPDVALPGDRGCVRISWDEDIPAYVVDDTIGD